MMQLNVTLKMTTARVVEMSVTVNYMHSLIQDIQTFPWRVCDAVNANMFRLYSSAILGLQPRDKAAMLGVKTKEYFLEEFT